MSHIEMDETFKVHIIDPTTGKLRSMIFCDGIPSEEIKLVLSSSLNQDIVGFYDDDGINYPLSLIAQNPKLFRGRTLSLISKDGTKQLYHDFHMSNQTSEASFLTESHAETAFKLLDLNSDNLVHKEEFIEVLSKAYELLIDYNPRYSFSYSCLSPKDLAIATSIQCYQSLDNGLDNYYLDFDDFCAYYLSSGPDLCRNLMISALDLYFEMTCKSDSPTNSQMASRKLKKSKSMNNLDLSSFYFNDRVEGFVLKCQYYLQLQQSDLSQLFDLLCLGTKKNSQFIKRSVFIKSYLLFLEQKEPTGRSYRKVIIENDDDIALREVLDEVIDICGPSEQDSVAVTQLAILICILTPGNYLQNINAVFQLFSTNKTNANVSNKISVQYMDTDASPSVDDSILYLFLLQALNLLFYFNHEMQSELCCFPEDLAHSISTKFLLLIDVNRKQKDKISFDEFIEVLGHSLKLCLEMLQIKEGFFMDYANHLLTYSFADSPLKRSPSEQYHSLLSLSNDPNISYSSNASASYDDYGPIIIDESMYPSPDKPNSLDIPSSPINLMEDSQIKAFFVEYCGDKISIQEAKSILGLENTSSLDLVNYLMGLADSNGLINLASYQKGIMELISKQYIESSVLQRSMIDFIVDRLFKAIDTGDKGYCHTIELGSAYLLFCPESFQKRAQAAYMLLLHHIPNDPISFKYLFNVLLAVYKAYDCLDPNADIKKSEIQHQYHIKSIMRRWVKEYYDISHDLFFMENTQDFVYLYATVLKYVEDNETLSHKESVASTEDVQFDQESDDSSGSEVVYSDDNYDDDGDNADSGSYESNIFLNDELYPPSSLVFELRATSAVLGLESFTAEDMMESLGNTSTSGLLSEVDWKKWLAYVSTCSNLSPADKPISNFIGMRLFESLLESYETSLVDFELGKVHYEDIACGLSILCCGSNVEERIMVAFTLSDKNSDGVLDFDEFQSMIFNILNTICVCSKIASDKVIQIGTTTQELAYYTSREAFNAMLESYPNLDVSSDDAQISLEMVVGILDDFLKLAALY